MTLTEFEPDSELTVMRQRTMDMVEEEVIRLALSCFTEKHKEELERLMKIKEE